MASVIQRPGKKFWVQFTYEGKRHTARLGMVSKSLAQRFSIDVQSLIDDHNDMKVDYSRNIWGLLIFTLWRESIGSSVSRSKSFAG